MLFMDKLEAFLGPNIDIWGTPETMLLKLLLVLLTRLLSFRFFRYERTNANASIAQPYASSFLINKSCGIQANTLNRSYKITPTAKF